jgi:hypothetical protein
VFQDKSSTWVAEKAELAALQKEAYERTVKQDFKGKKDEHQMQMKYEKTL